MFTNKIIFLPILLFFITASGISSQQKLPVNGMRPLEMKISSDGKHIIAAYDSCTIVWDISKRKILRRIPRELSYYPAYSSTIRTLNQDGSLLAVGNGLILSLYNTENNKLVKQFTVFEYRENPNVTDDFGFSTMIAWKQEYFKQIYFTPDRKNIIIVSDEDKIRYVDLARDTVSLVNVSDDLPRPSNQGDILDFNISQGRAVIMDNFSIIIFNLLSGKKEGEIPLKYNNMDFYPMSFSLNNNKKKHSILLIGDNHYENYLFFCDVENRKILNVRKLDGKAHIVQLTSVENITALANDDSICLYNFQTGTEIARLIAYEEPKTLTASPSSALSFDSLPKKVIRMTVQLGSFLSFGNASHFICDIEGEGFKPFIERTKINNSTFWRVVIIDVSEGLITTLSGLLKNAGFPEIWIRPDNLEL